MERALVRSLPWVVVGAWIALLALALCPAVHGLALEGLVVVHLLLLAVLALGAALDLEACVSPDWFREARIGRWGPWWWVGRGAAGGGQPS